MPAGIPATGAPQSQAQQPINAMTGFAPVGAGDLLAPGAMPNPVAPPLAPPSVAAWY